VWFAIDTSGSMSPTDLRKAVTELEGMLSSQLGTVSVLACDAAVQGRPTKVESWRDVVPMLTGGGGTNFRPIFDEYQAAKIKPKLIVIATDGDGPAPAQAPKGVGVVWLLTSAYCRAPVSWGEQICLGT
jgi:predicted metal-dependent peptidase